MLQAKYSAEEVVRRGQQLYDTQIRDRVETAHKGEFLVLDIESGEYEVDTDDIAASKRAKANHPNGILYALRVGFPAAYRLGATSPVKNI